MLKHTIYYFLPILILTIAAVAVFPLISKEPKVDEQTLLSANGVPTANLSTSPEVKGTTTNRENKTVNAIYLGMWTQGFFDPQTFTIHPEALKNVEKQINKKVAIAHYYVGWGELNKPHVLSELNTISENGWRPMLSANPYFFDGCKSNGQNIYKTIASGTCDDFMHQAAKNLKNFGKPLFLRFAWEMDTNTIEWAISKVGASPADFTSAWQRFHDIAKTEGASNITWVFSPNIGGNPTLYNSLYPGDSYVDWLSLDGYNWGTTQSWSSWQTFYEVFNSSYNALTRVSPQKPLMLAEVNTTNIGGDKASWYTDMLTTQLPKNFPQIKAVVFYNEDRTKKENVNWLLDITQASLDAFKKGINTTPYSSYF